MLRVFAAVLLLPGVLWPQEIKGVLTPPEYGFARLTIDAPGAAVTWRVSPNPVQKEIAGKVIRFGGKPGIDYVVTAHIVTVDWDKKTIDAAETEVTVRFSGTPVPPPPGPTPPGPTPPPDPPAPPAPIASAGFAVLIVYEEKDAEGKMTRAQQAAVWSADMRAWLMGSVVKGPDGKTPECRIWDKDIDTSRSPKMWQDAMARPRASLPWVVLSTGKTGYEGPLPATTAEINTLLTKYKKLADEGK